MVVPCWESEDQVLTYEDLELKSTVANCDGVSSSICVGVTFKAGDFLLCKFTYQEELVVCRIVEIIYVKEVETQKSSFKMLVNPFPIIGKEPIKGWVPIVEDNWCLNTEVYQSKRKCGIEVKSINLAFIYK
jgi:hypothetical protein